MGAVAWLVQETRRRSPPGIPEATIEGVIGRRHRTTELRIADALVAAIDAPQAWHDGTLKVRPNPRATPERRASCCG